MLFVCLFVNRTMQRNDGDSAESSPIFSRRLDRSRNGTELYKHANLWGRQLLQAPNRQLFYKQTWKEMKSHSFRLVLVLPRRNTNMSMMSMDVSWFCF